MLVEETIRKEAALRMATLLVLKSLEDEPKKVKTRIQLFHFIEKKTSALLDVFSVRRRKLCKNLEMKNE